MAPQLLYTAFGMSNTYFSLHGHGKLVCTRWNSETGHVDILSEGLHKHQISGAYATFDATMPITLDMDCSSWFSIVSKHVSAFLAHTVSQRIHTQHKSKRVCLVQEADYHGSDYADVRVNLELKQFAFRLGNVWYPVMDWSHLPASFLDYYVPALWFYEEMPADADDDMLMNCTLQELVALFKA